MSKLRLSGAAYGAGILDAWRTVQAKPHKSTPQHPHQINQKENAMRTKYSTLSDAEFLQYLQSLATHDQLVQEMINRLKDLLNG